MCYLTTFTLLYVHPPQTGSMFPNTLTFNLLTIQFTNVACNLTADNSYHSTISFIYCLLAVAILAICICEEMIMLCLVHSFILVVCYTKNLQCCVLRQWINGLVGRSWGVSAVMVD